MKTKLFNIRPTKGVHPILLRNYSDGDGFAEFIAGMGYALYQDPTNENVVLVSDRPLTFGDLKKMAKQLDIDLDWWNNTTDFNECLDDELDEYCQ